MCLDHCLKIPFLSACILVLLLPCVSCDLVKVISGQNLPKPGDIKGEIVDPYVVLQVAGVKEDKKEFKTKVVKDNGEFELVNHERLPTDRSWSSLEF